LAEPELEGAIKLRGWKLELKLDCGMALGQACFLHIFKFKEIKKEHTDEGQFLSSKNRTKNLKILIC
jgi:hypothetical protein